MTSPQYGAAHKKARKALLPKAYGTACPMCGVVMVQGMKLDLDHSLPHALGGAVGDRIVHARCNRSAGAKLGNKLRHLRHQRRLPTIGSSGSV